MKSDTSKEGRGMRRNKNFSEMPVKEQIVPFSIL
jgi:hypothetical protein